MLNNTDLKVSIQIRFQDQTLQADIDAKVEQLFERLVQNGLTPDEDFDTIYNEDWKLVGLNFTATPGTFTAWAAASGKFFQVELG